jgi:hypothetical protein
VPGFVYDEAEGGRRGTGRLLEVRKATLFETPLALGQMRVFDISEDLAR